MDFLLFLLFYSALEVVFIVAAFIFQASELLVGQVVKFNSAFVAALSLEILFKDLLNFGILKGRIQGLDWSVLENTEIIFSSVQDIVERDLSIPEGSYDFGSQYVQFFLGGKRSVFMFSGSVKIFSIVGKTQRIHGGFNLIG